MNIAAAPIRPARHPFPVPARLPPALVRVRDHWRSLMRGSAAIPFSDDLDMTALADLKPQLVLIRVFARPERFRFEMVGAALGADLEDRFLDETGLGQTGLGRPFEYLRAQCAATVEAAAPTAYRQFGQRAYVRLLTPFWGDGRIDLLLGIVSFA